MKNIKRLLIGVIATIGLLVMGSFTAGQVNASQTSDKLSVSDVNPDGNTTTCQYYMERIGWQDGGELSFGIPNGGLKLYAFMTPNSVEAKANLSAYGWTNVRYGGEIVGAPGDRKQINEVQLTGNIKYRVYVANIGWTKWCSSGEIAGNGGSGQAIQAIQIIRVG